METLFQEGIQLLKVPMRPVEVPYAGKSLAGYYLEHDDQERPLVLMIGGGDTFREDLFYFAGYPGWKRGYNVMMVDLPSQGLMPARGLTMQVDMPPGRESDPSQCLYAGRVAAGLPLSQEFGEDRRVVVEDAVADKAAALTPDLLLLLALEA